MKKPLTREVVRYSIILLNIMDEEPIDHSRLSEFLTNQGYEIGNPDDGSSGSLTAHTKVVSWYEGSEQMTPCGCANGDKIQFDHDGEQYIYNAVIGNPEAKAGFQHGRLAKSI